MDNDTKKLIIEIVLLNINEIYSIINNLKEHFNNLLFDQIISEKKYYDNIDKLKNYLYIINEYDQKINKIVENNFSTELLDLQNNILGLRKNILNLIIEFGYSSIIDIFEIILSYDIYKQYHDEINNKLKFIDKYFIIKKIKTEQTNSFKQVNIKIKDSTNKEIKPDFDIKMINLIYELNKSVVEIEIDDTIYFIHGYFKEDIINQIYKNTFFKEKYNNLIKNTFTNVSKIIIDLNNFKGFCKDYINQLSIKDFILKDNYEIIYDINNKYINYLKISKLNINDILENFINADIYEKRNTIVLLLIDDSDSEIDELNTNDDKNEYEDSFNFVKFDEVRINDDVEKEENIVSILDNYNNLSKKIVKINSIMKKLDICINKKILNANVLLDLLKKNILSQEEYTNFIKSIHINLRKRIFLKENEKNKIKIFDDLTYEMKLDLLEINEKSKKKVTEKINEINNSKDNSKAVTFVDGFFNIPFTKYIKEDIFINCEKSNEIITKLIDQLNNYIDEKNKIIINDNDNKIKDKIKHNNIFEVKILAETLINEKNKLINIKTNYLNKVDLILNKSIYGHNDSKREIKRIIAQWMNNGKMDGAILGFHGPPGVGKTVFAQKGISKCLVDDENNTRPFCIFQLGGASDGAVLEGHNYTYVGSKWGRLVDMLMDAKCMNPIIYFDELDKISSTDKGKEIIDILIHITDKSQNNKIFDKYFSGIELDFSKCIIIFSYNDVSKVDRILRDRITEIKINSLNKNEKIYIIQNFTLKEISESLNYECKMQDKLIEYIIETYTFEAGIRKLNEKINELFKEINLRQIENPNINIELDEKLIDEILTRHYKMKHYKIHTVSQIGLVNGLYASTTGLGGITLIQVIKSITNSANLPLELTGQQGNVMKESMSCAKTLALSLLTIEERYNINYELQKNPFGLHIHCPDTSTPKDGPSAGITITLGIYSVFVDKPIRNDIAMTGEVDLLGNVKAIGGLDTKINGAIKAGVKTVLFPKENEEDYKKIIDKKSLDGEIECIMVSTIDEVIKLSLIN